MSGFRGGDIVAIDPGPKTSGIVRWRPSELRVVQSSSQYDTKAMLEGLRTGSLECYRLLVEDMQPMGVVGRDVIDNAKLVGRIEEILEERGKQFRLVRRSWVKITLCGSSRAKDPHLTRVVKDMVREMHGLDDDRQLRGRVSKTVNEPGPLYGVSGHAWAALALVMADRVDGETEKMG